MKKHLNIFVILFLICIPVFSDAQLKLDLTVAKNSIVECEPVPIVLTWQNTSTKDLKLGHELTPDQSHHVTVLVDGNPTLKLPVPPVGNVDYIRGAKESLDPGERKSGGVSILDLDLQPGNKYVIKAVADFTSNSEGYFRGIVESNSLTVSIKYPSGTDRYAFLDAENHAVTQGIDGKDRRLRICIELRSERVIMSHPDSIYAAWQLAVSYIDRVDNSEPTALAKLIHQEMFPEPRSVPTGPEPSQSLTLRGKELAKWQYDRALGILTKFPDFPRGDSLRLSIAANAFVLGKKDEAFRLLREAENNNNSELANWAQEFDRALRSQESD